MKVVKKNISPQKEYNKQNMKLHRLPIYTPKKGHLEGVP